MKKWEINMEVNSYYINWRGKKVQTPYSFGMWPYLAMAETEEEAKQKAIEIYNESNNNKMEKEYIFGRIDNWDSWTVEKAMKYCNGKEFKLWAEQQGLEKLFQSS